MKTRIPLLPVLILLALATGCETSSAFKLGVGTGGPRLAAQADAYLASDTVLDANTHATRAAQVVQFRVATTQPITFRPVYDSWSQLKPWYVGYVQSDPKMADVNVKAARQALIDGFDDDVEHERVRRLIFFQLDTPLTGIGR